MLNKIPLIIAIAICATLPLHAQKKTASPLSRLNIGELEVQSFGKTSSIGHATAAIKGKKHLILGNPASIASIDTNSFTYEFGLSNRYIENTEENRTSGSSAAGFDYAALGFPVGKKMGTQIGIIPYSSTGYRLEYTTSPEETIDSIFVKYRLEGEGNISRLFLEHGIRITENISIGAGVSYLFGRSEQVSSNSFPNASNFQPVLKQSSNYTTGFVFNTGIHLSKKFKDNEILFGAEYTFKSKLNTEYNYKSGISGIYDLNNFDFIDFNTILAENSKENLDTETPSKLNIGLSLSQENKFLVTANYLMQDWSNSKIYGSNHSSQGTLSRTSLGGEITPNFRSRSFFKRMTYRAGFHYGSTYWNLIGSDSQEETMHNIGMTFGFGLPKRLTNHSLNLICELGQTYTNDDSLLKSKYILLKLNITLHYNDWFIKRKID